MGGLRVDGLTVRYGRALAVDGVDLEVESGQITVVVGPNGAGKSSLLGAIYGSVTANGSVRVDGEEVSALSPMRRARAGVRLVPQGRQLFTRMSVRENFEVMAEMLGVPRSEVEAAMERFPILRTRARSLAGVLSGGEQQMLAVARSLMGRPRVLLLDEMATGLAPTVVQNLIGTVETLAAEGVAVLMAEPSIGGVREHLGRGFVLLRGRVVAEATDGEALDRAYQDRMGLVSR
jgi:branched-chain amino acid transport system ATP-binding protein